MPVQPRTYFSPPRTFSPFPTRALYHHSLPPPVQGRVRAKFVCPHPRDTNPVLFEAEHQQSFLDPKRVPVSSSSRCPLEGCRVHSRTLTRGGWVFILLPGCRKSLSVPPWSRSRPAAYPISQWTENGKRFQIVFQWTRHFLSSTKRHAPSSTPMGTVSAWTPTSSSTTLSILCGRSDPPPAATTTSSLLHYAHPLLSLRQEGGRGPTWASLRVFGWCAPQRV